MDKQELAELLMAENVILAESCPLEQRIASGSETRCSRNAPKCSTALDPGDAIEEGS